MPALTLYARLFAVTLLLFALGLLLPGCATTSTPATPSDWNSATLSGMTPVTSIYDDVAAAHLEMCQAFADSSVAAYDAAEQGLPSGVIEDALLRYFYQDGQQPGPFALGIVMAGIDAQRQGLSREALHTVVVRRCSQITDPAAFSIARSTTF